MKIEPTPAQKRQIARAKKQLESKHGRKVYALGSWGLRFSYRGSYFDYWPTSGKWIYSHGERRITCGAGNRYSKAPTVEILVAALDSFCAWLKAQKEVHGSATEELPGHDAGARVGA